MYVKTTRNIKVQVESFYVPEKSDPSENRYIWSYSVMIENLSADKIQLMHRYLYITDAWGRTEEIHSDGVVGEQPVLEAGERFGYESGVSLMTPSGIMVGHYTFEKKSTGGHFDVDIPAFSIDCPYQTMRQH
jgi:ApaG protein